MTIRRTVRRAAPSPRLSKEKKEADLRAEDMALLRRRGISMEDVRAQLRHFRSPPAYVRLDRAAKPGDGVHVLSKKDCADYASAGEAAVRDGRVMKFVPASGAASRMFQCLSAFLT